MAAPEAPRSQWLRRGGDCGYDAADVDIADPGAGGEADAALEERLADAVDVGGIGAIDGLAVHRLPERTALYAGLVQSHAQRLHIGVRLAVGHSRRRRMRHTCRAADSTLDHLTVGVLLTLYPQILVEERRAEPEVGVEAGRRRLVHRDAGDIGQQFLIELLHVAMMGDMLVGDRHLAAAYARANV